MEGDQIPQPLYQPGQQVQPGSGPSPAPTPAPAPTVAPTPSPAPPEPQPTPNIPSVAPEPTQPIAQQVPQPAAPQPPVFQQTAATPPTVAPASPAPAPQQATDDGDSVSWTASEYIHHQKQAGWYMALMACAVVLAAFLFVAQHDFTAPVVVLLAATALWVFGARKPRTLTYRISAAGISIENKGYSYDKFRSFSVVDDGEVPSLLLTPLQRFVPPISIYYDLADEEMIVGAISQFLPHEDKELDTVDRLSRRLKF